MTKIEKTIWELAQLYDFYQKIKQYRIKKPKEEKKDSKIGIEDNKFFPAKKRRPSGSQ
jgi:hypothetical protein